MQLFDSHAWPSSITPRKQVFRPPFFQMSTDLDEISQGSVVVLVSSTWPGSSQGGSRPIHKVTDVRVSWGQPRPTLTGQSPALSNFGDLCFIYANSAWRTRTKFDTYMSQIDGMRLVSVSHTHIVSRGGAPALPDCRRTFLQLCFMLWSSVLDS